MSISASELAFVQEALKSDLRNDGRARLDWRPLNLSAARNIAPAANGSARVKLGGTDIIAACRLEVEEVSEGSLDVYVECTPAALNTLDSDATYSLVAHLRALFSRFLQGNKQLAILPGRRAWVISLDITVMSADGGNLLDAASCAARHAVATMRIPKTRAVGYTSAKGAGKASDGMASLLKSGAAKTQKGKGKAADFELDSYWDEGDVLKCAEDLPVSVTLNLLGDLHFVDATLAEERSCQSRLMVGADAKQRIRLIKQEGELELEADLLERLIETGSQMAVDLIETLNAQRELG